MKKLMVITLSSFVLTFTLAGCDQKPSTEQVDCSKPITKMTDSEKNKCGKGGQFTKSPEKKW